jgi:hypothetical protein
VQDNPDTCGFYWRQSITSAIIQTILHALILAFAAVVDKKKNRGAA